MKLVDLAQDKGNFWAAVTNVMNIRVPYNAENFLSSWGNCMFRENYSVAWCCQFVRRFIVLESIPAKWIQTHAIPISLSAFRELCLSWDVCGCLAGEEIPRALWNRGLDYKVRMTTPVAQLWPNQFGLLHIRYENFSVLMKIQYNWMYRCVNWYT